MQAKLLWLGLMLYPAILQATPTATVPWEEFRDLYRAQIEQQWKKANPETTQVAPYTLEQASYQIYFEQQQARAEVMLSGQVLAGEVSTIPLFGHDVAVAEIQSVEGGTLISLPEGLGFLPIAETSFQIKLSLLIHVGEDKHSRLLSMAVPQAIRNSLQLHLKEGDRLSEPPGLPNGDNRFQFSSRSRLDIRLQAEDSLQATTNPEVDTLTRVRIRDRGLLLESYFVPISPLNAPLRIHPPAGSHFISASVKSSWIREDAGDHLIQVPKEWQAPFSMQYLLENRNQQGHYTLLLPTIAENTGSEGRFVIDEPEYGRLTLQGEGLSQTMLAKRLPTSLRHLLTNTESYRHLANGKALTLGVDRFTQVDTPEVVLDALYFFSAYEEGGDALSILKLQLPPEAGPRLHVKQVAGAKIWSLKVNGKNKTVYNINDSWVIPLARGKVSRVELAYLQQGDKLGLRGRLEAKLPQTGLPAREVFFGIALPARVQLVSMEANLSPTLGAQWPLPKEFAGQRYFFKRAFYQGKGMKASIYYKEPTQLPGEQQ